MNPFQPSEHPKTHKEFHDLLVGNRLAEMRSFLQNPPEDFDIDGPVKAGEETTGLQYAILNMYYDMVELLLEFNADPNAYDKFKQTAVHAAFTDGATEVIPSLIAHGGKMDASSVNKETPFAVVDLGNPKAVTMGLNLGVHPDDRHGDNGFTNLMSAAVGDYVESARLLLEAGADPLAESTDGRQASRLGNLNVQSETRDLVNQYAALPRLEAGKDYSLSDLLAGKPGARLLDNPYNWRNGLPEKLEELSAKGEHLTKQDWLKPEPLMGKSLADIALAARQGDGLLALWSSQGEPLSQTDLFSGGEPTSLCSQMAQYGQLKWMFDSEHAVQFAPSELSRAYQGMPEEARICVNLHTLLATVKRQQKLDAVEAERGRA